jgi:ribonuclease P protein component
LIVYFQSGVTNEARLGITASRKVGSSVVRQKVKRRIREIFRRWPGRSALEPIDVVVHLKPEAGKAPFLPLREDLERLLGTLPRSRRKADPPPAVAES